jgi:hypothetical protein
MDVETPIGGRDRTKGLHRERGGCSMRGSLAVPYTGGLFPLHEDVGLGSPMMSPTMLMTSSNIYGHFGRQLWHMWQLGEAQGGIMFFSKWPKLP